MAQITDERLVKILSETQATIMEHNSRCVRGSVEVDARLFESMIIELQERRKADSEPVAEVVSIYGDPEAFGEREIRPLVGIQQMPYGTKLYRHAQPAPDYFASLVAAARIRADKAMSKFPQPNYVLNKVAEESGEVIKAVIHYTEGREVWANVEYEIIDNLAMLLRLVKEGDQVIGFTPPDSCRAAMLSGGKS